MEVFEAMLKRRSCREFTNQKVTDEDIDKLLHAAMSGPSACNARPWEFYVIKDVEVLAKLRKATPYSDINGNVAIIVVGNMKRALKSIYQDYWIEDTSAATENILLEATELGLGSLWCGVYPQKENIKNISNILVLKEHQIPMSLIYIGYPAIENEPRDQYTEKAIHII